MAQPMEQMNEPAETWTQEQMEDAIRLELTDRANEEMHGVIEEFSLSQFKIDINLSNDNTVIELGVAEPVLNTNTKIMQLKKAAHSYLKDVVAGKFTEELHEKSSATRVDSASQTRIFGGSPKDMTAALKNVIAVNNWPDSKFAKREKKKGDDGIFISPTIS